MEWGRMRSWGFFFPFSKHDMLWLDLIFLFQILIF